MSLPALQRPGAAVDIPLLAARHSVDTPDASVTPEVPVKHTFEAQAAGLDQELEAVGRLIGKQDSQVRERSRPGSRWFAGTTA